MVESQETPMILQGGRGGGAKGDPGGGCVGCGAKGDPAGGWGGGGFKGESVETEMSLWQRLLFPGNRFLAQNQVSAGK